MDIQTSVSRIVCFCFFLLGTLLLSSCTSMTSSTVKMQLTAARQLNPDDNFHSLPVRVKLFQLSDNTAFEEAAFQQLWKDEKKSLGSSLLAQKEITLAPGERIQLKMKRHSGAEYFAVVALFRQQMGHQWKAIKPVPGPINNLFTQIQITVKGQQVELR